MAVSTDKSEAQDRGEYLDVYYQINRGTIAEQKAERYKNDPVYREKILLASKKRWLKKSVSPVLRLGVLLKRPKRGARETMIDGKHVILRNITEFARSLGVKSAVVRGWHKDGIIPEATVVEPMNHRRWYSNRYILKVRFAYVLRNGKSRSDLKEAVDKQFNR